MGRTRRTWIAATIIGLAPFAGRWSVAQDKPPAGTVAVAAADDPRYAAWSSFNVGSKVTLIGDIDTGDGHGTLEMTSTLMSVDQHRQSVTITTAGRMTAKGHEVVIPAKDETITPKSSLVRSRVVGEQDVAVVGKTFKCKVYEVANLKDGHPDGKTTMIAYITDAIPGGMVKCEGGSPQGLKIKMAIESYDAK